MEQVAETLAHNELVIQPCKKCQEPLKIFACMSSIMKWEVIAAVETLEHFRNNENHEMVIHKLSYNFIPKKMSQYLHDRFKHSDFQMQAQNVCSHILRKITSCATQIKKIVIIEVLFKSEKCAKQQTQK